MDNRIKELFERYQAGKANKAERKLVEDWFVRFAEDGNTDPLHADLFDKMDSNIANLLAGHKCESWFNNHWLQMAAVLITGLTVTLFIYLHQINNTVQNITYSFIKTHNGTKKTFSLPDGSTVCLNSGSVISIPSNFGSTSREISLTGEAFFIVKHNAAKPFIIHSGKLLITDLGTSFNVKAYADSKKIQVSVETGKVKIEKNNNEGKPMVFANAVTPNHRFTYDPVSDNYNLSIIQASDLIGWRQNRLRFENASFDEIAHMLERWYNVNINLNGSDKHCRLYTVSFDNEPITHVLDVLSNLSGIQYQIHPKAVNINLKECKP